MNGGLRAYTVIYNTEGARDMARLHTFGQWSHEAVHVDPWVTLARKRVVFDPVKAGSIHKQTLRDIQLWGAVRLKKQ